MASRVVSQTEACVKFFVAALAALPACWRLKTLKVPVKVMIFAITYKHCDAMMSMCVCREDSSAQSQLQSMSDVVQAAVADSPGLDCCECALL